jgi:hypothetical protein
MRALPSALLVCVSFAMAACVGTNTSRPSLARLLRDAPNDAPARLAIAGDHLVFAAVPIGSGSLPKAVRTPIDAIAPGGRTLFVGREWGERGDGFRVEKAYDGGGKTQTRSVLAAADGAVLERWHTVAIAEVPQHVMATALRTGPTIDEARIVSGPEREEHWAFVVRDRAGSVFVVKVSLDGEGLGRVRQSAARLDS